MNSESHRSAVVGHGGTGAWFRCMRRLRVFCSSKCLTMFMTVKRFGHVPRRAAQAMMFVGVSKHRICIIKPSRSLHFIGRENVRCITRSPAGLREAQVDQYTPPCDSIHTGYPKPVPITYRLPPSLSKSELSGPSRRALLKSSGLELENSLSPGKSPLPLLLRQPWLLAARWTWRRRWVQPRSESSSRCVCLVSSAARHTRTSTDSTMRDG